MRKPNTNKRIQMVKANRKMNAVKLHSLNRAGVGFVDCEAKVIKVKSYGIEEYC